MYACKPVPAFPGRYGIRESVIAAEVCPAVARVAAAAKAKVIDLHGPMADAGGDFPDTVHPNAAGAKRMADLVAKALLAPAAGGSTKRH